MKIVKENIHEELLKLATEKSCIIVIRNDITKTIHSYIINNNRLKFTSCSNPSCALFLNDHPKKILETQGNTLVYELFEEFSYSELIKFTKAYDKEFKGVSEEFYIKYKDYFEKMI